ncbi:MAG: hypothetical protein P1U36_06875 [Legionellaceae bacterium]|nr:hypothetical protein [Legionellaceae bacterium]
MIKKNVIFTLFFLLIDASFAHSTNDFLPMALHNDYLSFSTQDIPESLSVTVQCRIYKKNKKCPNKKSSILIFPEEKKISSIVQQQSYDEDCSYTNADGEWVYETCRRFRYEKLGDILYQENTKECDFSFFINGVTHENKNIVIFFRKENSLTFTGNCFY